MAEEKLPNLEISVLECPIPLCIIDSNGNFITWNENFLTILNHDLKNVDQMLEVFEITDKEKQDLKKWIFETNPTEKITEVLHRCHIHPEGMMIKIEKQILKDNKKCLFFENITTEKLTQFILQERDKEISFLHTTIDNISSIFKIDDFLQQIVDTFPTSMLFPDLACIMISYKDEKEALHTYKSQNYRDQKGPVIKCPIQFQDNAVGEVIVGYTEDIKQKQGLIIPLEIENTFLKEEENLTNSLAKIIGDFINLSIMLNKESQFQDTLKVLSTPVMVLGEKILLLPLVGPIDSRRTQIIMDSLLAKVIEVEAKYALIDIQGVPAMDTLVADHIIKLTKATKLLGCSCIITGVSPKISQTLVQLGIDLSTFETEASLKDGLTQVVGILKK